MTDYADTRALEIASMVDEKQQAVAIRAYGDQRAREAVEQAAKEAERAHDFGDSRSAFEKTKQIAAAILALIPKEPRP